MLTGIIKKEILFDVLNNPGDSFYENAFSDFLDEQNIEHDFRKPLHNDKIIELKPYHEKYLNIWVNHWISVNLCTRSTNESKAEQYFCDFYKELGLSKPKNIIWFNNPVEMLGQARNKRWDRINNQILNQVMDQVIDQVINKIWNQVGKMQWQVWSLVWDQVSNRDKIWYGQQNSHWLAFYAYMMQVLRVESPTTLMELMLLAQEVNCWFPTKETIYATRKPKECIFENGRFVKLVHQDNYTIT
jgi:hypothetical protein